MLVLVDTSIWVNLLGRNPSVELTERTLERVAICPPILQEILQGISNIAVRDEIKERLLGLSMIGDKLTVEDYIAAADIYTLGRKKGYTIRSSTDCLIAALAIKRNLPVWHQDRDYENIAAFTQLRTMRGKKL